MIIGLSYHRLTQIDVTGLLQQGIAPPYYAAGYHYTMQLSQLLAEAKVQHQWNHIFYPYVTAGIGGGFNSAKYFHTTVPEYLTVTPAYRNHNSSTLSYSLGLGIDTLVHSNATLGIGYLFSDIGQTALGNGFIRERVVANYLNQSHVYVNTLQVQLSCYFN
jgi:opacity protein-like surface antigen